MTMTLQYLPILILIPLFLCFIIKKLFNNTISINEIVIQFIAGIVFVAISFAMMIALSVNSQYYANGKVLSKNRERVSCSHSYQICSGTGEDRVCTTYYRHTFDYDWVVKTSVGNLTIDRQDSQGIQEPRRFSAVNIGENASLPHSYPNYIKNSKQTLHLRKLEQTVKVISKPNIFDYYRKHNYVSDFNIPLDIENTINEYAKTHGHNKNVIYYFTRSSTSIAESTRAQWNIEINDIVVLLGITDNEIIWSDILTYADNYQNAGLKGEIPYLVNNTTFNQETINELNSFINKRYKSISANDLKYLITDNEISLTQWIVLIFFNIIFNSLVGYYMHRNEI